MKGKIIETELSFIQLIDERIIRLEIKDDKDVDGKMMMENFAVYKQLLGKKKGLFLTIIPPFVSTERDLRSIYEDRERIELKESEAFVVPNLSSRIEVDYLTLEMSKYYPVKLFKEEKKALAWLKTFVK